MSHHVTVAAERTPAQRSQQSLHKLPSPSGKSRGQHRRQSEAPRRHPRRRLRPAGQLHSAHTCVTQPDVGYACVVLKCESVLGVKTLLRYLVDSTRLREHGCLNYHMWSSRSPCRKKASGRSLPAAPTPCSAVRSLVRTSGSLNRRAAQAMSSSASGGMP